MVFYPKEVSKVKLDLTKYSLAYGPNFMIFYAMAMMILMGTSLGINIYLGNT